MGSLETAILIPVGSVDLIGGGLVDSVTNTINGLVKLVGEIGLS